MTSIKLALIAISLLCSSAFADEICKAQTSLGPIVGHGATALAAKADASNRCFDRHMAAYEGNRGVATESKGLDIIDHCANIECK